MNEKIDIPKRHFYNEKDYKLDFKKKVMILDSSLHKKLLNKTLWGSFGFKKIGGSSVGDVLKVDNFKSDFAAFARICYCGLPIFDRKYVDAGIAIEPKVVSSLEKVLKMNVKTFNPKEYDFDYFKDKDPIIGGIPDGYIEQLKTIIEIKTTLKKNYENWEKFGVPLGYLKQAQLYTYLMGVEDFWIVATFLEEDDYNDPSKYPIEKRILKNYRYKINKNQVLDDIEYIKSWYKKHTNSGISPIWTNNDNDLIEFLKCRNEDEYKELIQNWINEGKI